jgi:hypothetical protein
MLVSTQGRYLAAATFSVQLDPSLYKPFFGHAFEPKLASPGFSPELKSLLERFVANPSTMEPLSAA